MNNTRKLIFMGLLVAAALALSFVESFLFLPVFPGAKLGLANIVTVAALYILPQARDAALVLAVRVILGGVFVGGASVFYSAAGAALSFLVMWFLKRARGFGVVSVSMAGGFFHNIGQLLAAAALVSSTSFFLAYLPVLGLAGLAAGFFVGFVIDRTLKKGIQNKFDFDVNL
ncbi:MAG: Gx transporter family protein [Selenomonadaceae bacterium]|nr:Gx transporter family protein [Selenomonadaceae bacterium]